MREFHQTSSDDESEHQISFQVHRTVDTYTHKKNASTSLIHPRRQRIKPNKNATKKPTKKHKSQLIVSRSKKPIQQQTDFLIVGDSYYGCRNIEEVSSRLLRKQTEKVMRDQRLRRKQRQCVRKIEKYMKTFLHKAKETPIMKRQQRVQLYHLLKEELKDQSQGRIMENLLRSVLATLESRTEKLLETYPHYHQQIQRWKNNKMHQLMTAQSLLLHEETLAIDIFNLDKELEFLNEDNLYPELREEALTLQKQIKDHLTMTSSVRGTLREDDGVRWVLNRLFQYLAERPMQWECVAKTLEEYEAGFRDSPLLSDRLFIEFQREQIGSGESEEDQQQQSYLHIFNKCVFDLINQTALKIQLLEPSLECLRGVFGAAEGEVSGCEWQHWREDLLLWVDELIYQQLLDDSLQDFLDFY